MQGRGRRKADGEPIAGDYLGWRGIVWSKEYDETNVREIRKKECFLWMEHIDRRMRKAFGKYFPHAPEEKRSISCECSCR